MRPQASCLSTAALRCLPIATRRATQRGLRPSRAPTARSLIPSSSIREQTTRASSEAVSVRRGVLASSNSRLSSAAEPARSSTTGTSWCPCSSQLASRLKPSMTSQRPSWLGATRMGPGAVRAGRDRTSPGRRSWYVVCSCSIGTRQTPSAQATGAGNDAGAMGSTALVANLLATALLGSTTDAACPHGHLRLGRLCCASSSMTPAWDATHGHLRWDLHLTAIANHRPRGCAMSANPRGEAVRRRFFPSAALTSS